MNKTDKKSSLYIERHLPLAVIMVVATVCFFTFADSLTFSAIKEHRQELILYRDTNYLLTSVVFMLAYIVIVSFSLPGATVASLTGGFLFGLFPGTLFNICSATIGATAIFIAVRMGLGEYLTRKVELGSPTVKRMRKRLKENEISILFLLRLIPAIPFFAANIIPALAGVNLPKFIFTTFFGIIPGTIIYTWVGAGLGEVFSGGETPDLGIIFEWYILGPILGLCVLATFPIVFKVISKRRGADY